MSAFRIIIALLVSTFTCGMTGFEIMQKVHENRNNYSTLQAEVTMTIKNKSGTRHRLFILKEKDYVTEKRSLAKFYLPANIKGVALLTHWYDAP